MIFLKCFILIRFENALKKFLAQLMLNWNFCNEHSFNARLTGSFEAIGIFNQTIFTLDESGKFELEISNKFFDEAKAYIFIKQDTALTSLKSINPSVSLFFRY